MTTIRSMNDAIKLNFDALSWWPSSAEWEL